MKKKSLCYLPKSKKWPYAALGALLSFIGPLGEWLVITLWFKEVDRYLPVTLIYIEILCLVMFCFLGYMMGRHAEKIEELAFYDQLTGLFSRHYLIKKLTELIEYSGRYQQSFSLIILDLDHFKSVNDTYGHVIGDKTLKAVAKNIATEIRASDFAGRYGGEEFIVVCPSTRGEECRELAERIRMAIQKLDVNALNWPGPQTISAGVCEIQPDFRQKSIAKLIDYADIALYNAKATGRNKVVVYSADVDG